MKSKALNRALDLIADGTLSIDAAGRIWRHRSDGHGGRGAAFPRRAESTGGNGYLRLMLWIDGELRGVGAHRVIWTHFNGPIHRTDQQINHRDLDKRNNQPSNLELVTGAENIRHSYANGRTHPWSIATEWRGRDRLTVDQITEARRLRSTGVLLRDIATRLQISTTHAHRITS